MKLIEIVNAHNIVDGFAEQENLGVHLAYVMTKFVIATQTDADFYAKELRKLFEKFGAKNDNGETVVPAENIETFSQEVAKLQETEVEQPTIKFSLKELANGLTISMKQIYPLMSFIEDDQD